MFEIPLEQLSPLPAWVPLPGRSLLRLNGIDRVSFLQALVTNDVTQVSREWSVYTVLLTPQGKILHDIFIAAAPPADDGSPDDEAFLLDVEKARRDDLLERLRRYKLRARVGFEDLDGRFEVVALIGGTAAATVGLPASPGATNPFQAGIAMVDPRLAALGVRLMIPCGGGADLVMAGGAVAGSFEDYEMLRLDQGVPEGSRDLLVDKTLPLENNLDALNAISWTKGCYVGQEVTARTRYRGLVRRRLRPVWVEGQLPPPDTTVMANGVEAGEVRSGCGNLALVMLRLDIQDAASVKLTAGDAVLSPLVPGWAQI
ncbi:MAG: folate-binding protein [Rhodospirillaceae bacterium]